MSTRWKLYWRVQGLEEEKPAYWNWLEKHRNLREVKKMASLNGSLELKGGPVVWVYPSGPSLELNID